MEIVIALLALGVLGYLMFSRKKEVKQSLAPYKVDPAPVEQTPVNLEQESDVSVEQAPAMSTVEESAPDTKAKKTRKPRASKAEKQTTKKAGPKKPAPMKRGPRSKKS
jgi:BRCT domain type II-containing protein